MAIEIEIDKKTKKAFVKDPSSVGSLSTGFFGNMRRGTIELEAEEALYLFDLRNATCFDKERNICQFNELARMYSKKLKLTRYFAYCAWRNRGLIAKPVFRIEDKFAKMPVVDYPAGKFEKYDFGFLGSFFEDDLTCLVEDEFAGKKIYEDGWFGQYGTYKAEGKGKICKLDAYETLFLQKHGGLEVDGISRIQIEKACRKRRADFDKLYFVYEDWRLNGFILKTGFKFGTHFRIYFPGAGPSRGEAWTHSEHVLHVFARKSRMLISEWARAIRVAHSVRKTFVLAIDGQKKNETGKTKKISLDFVLYTRNGDKISKPGQDEPSHLMMAMSEEEYLSGEQLAHAIEECKALGLGLMLAIVDRETAVTFYEVKRINIPGCEFEYYQLEWAQP